ncbi:hypothetical protein [Pelosinus sp. UFO1]|uniref:hypothetical protein n=1 Tax=Pelosinus sp. UFO1 TaxID=484770 RepID=UPI0004D13324|nr:hypothetical protein [Pelosinus sp. UFO1]AIF52045.1 hypothetical protein UFO1_2498 [Pelosinus sp. UFO1]
MNKDLRPARRLINGMTLEEFKKRFIKDLEDAKRKKLHKEGHTDDEIAVCCGVAVKKITRWRLDMKLAVNSVIHGKSFKSDIESRKRLGHNRQL